MKTNRPFGFGIYQWFITIPILLIITIFTAIATMFLSPFLPNSQIAYFPARWWGRLWCYLFFIRVKVVGLDNLNLQKSYVIACNHQSIYDVFVVYGWLPLIFKWIMKAELRHIPLVGKACQAAGHIFISRENPVAAKKSLERAEAQLKNGSSVVIFPEGMRTFDGRMGAFKKGAFLIATELKLPVLPVTLNGCFKCLPRNSARISPGVIEMIIHKPIEPSQLSQCNVNELSHRTHETIQSSLKSF